MATVELIPFSLRESSDLLPKGATAYETEMYLPGNDPFPGPESRNWAGFEVSGDCAVFEWRTCAQQVWGVARKYVEGEVSLEKALVHPLVDRYLAQVRERALEDDRLPEDMDSYGEEFPDWMLSRIVECPDEFFETCEEPFQFYSFDEDDYFHDASEALPLPPWAERHRVTTGGMGSGKDSAVIALAPGKTLTDLADWLREKERAA